MADEVAHDAGVAEARARVELRSQIERSDVQGDAVAEAVLRAELGDDYEPATRVLAKHIAGLPGDQVNRLNLQDPATLRRLGRDAVGELPATRAGMEAELAEARKRMAKPGGEWHQDERAQLRYRAILETLHGKGER